MKRVLSTIVAEILATSLVACNTSNTESSGSNNAGGNQNQGTGTSEEHFRWNDNVIVGLSDSFPGDLTTLVFPARTEGINGALFSETENNVETVSFESDKDIPIDFVFSGAEKIKSVTLPAELKEIGDLAFSSATALENIVIPSSVEVIGTGAFSNTENLKKLKCPRV